MSNNTFAMNEQYKQSLKSNETEDWFDFHIKRPFAFQWARLAAALDMHPNTITVLSMFVGAGSSFFFAHGSFYYEGWHGLMMNVVAVALLAYADVLDCVDGQLARLTGKKSRIGRILDGSAGFVWFIPIYLCIVYRFYQHHSLEFGLLGLADTEANAMVATAVVLVMSLFAGFMGMGGHSRAVDYYIQIHLLLLKGEKGTELETSEKVREAYEGMSWRHDFIYKLFQHSYVGYTEKQERATPMFQRLRGAIRERYGSVDALPAEVREELVNCSRRLMKVVTVIPFNLPTTVLYVACLADVPVFAFVFEIVFMSMLVAWVCSRHEAFCKRMAEKILDSQL